MHEKAVDLFVHDLGHDNQLRIVFYNEDGDNFWYDIKAHAGRDDYFWFPESLGYVKLYFIGEGYGVPKWVKQGCGWR
jgi:hypothetical protein